MATMAQPSTALFASLMAVADSGLGPATNVRRPMASMRGMQRPTASSGPPTTMPSCPAAAKSGRPSTGAATSVWPAARWRASSSRTMPTPCVPMTTWIAPSASDSQSPPGPSAAFSTIASSTSIETTTSVPAASSGIEPATRAPAAANGSVAAATTLKTVSSCPAPCKRPAMPRPMRPRPMNPTFMLIP